MEGILCRGVDASPPKEICCGAVRLQLHSVQGEPVSSRHRIELLTHGKPGDEQKRVTEYFKDSISM